MEYVLNIYYHLYLDKSIGTKSKNPATFVTGFSFLAETAGFEPAWDCSLTDFESAPL